MTTAPNLSRNQSGRVDDCRYQPGPAHARRPWPVSPATPDAVAARCGVDTRCTRSGGTGTRRTKPVAPEACRPDTGCTETVASPATSPLTRGGGEYHETGAGSRGAAPPPAPAETGLRVLVEADVGDRSGLGRYTAESYASLLKGELETVSSDFLGCCGPERCTQSGVSPACGRPGRRRALVLAGGRTARVLLADVSILPAASSVASAYWPEVRFTAINCGDGRLHSSRRLEPQRADRFEYQKDFAQRAHDFVASQGYFLRP